MALMHRRALSLALIVALASLTTTCLARPTDAAPTIPAPQIFAPGEISGPANDGAPTFSPDGKTLFYTRSTANWTVIVESHKLNGHWSHPTLAPFSGQWPDSSPALSSANPPNPDKPISNLWRVDRRGSTWSEPRRLPDTVNLPGLSLWKPSIAADGTVYLTAIDKQGNKRLYAAQPTGGGYQPAQPLSFSDGTTADVDPEVAPDQTFLVFVSSGRMPGKSGQPGQPEDPTNPANPKDHLFIVLKAANGWGPVTPIRYAGDDKPNGFSTDDEPRLGPDHRTLYFSSDRVIPVHFPRTHKQARLDLERMDLWDNSNSNIWSLPLSPWLNLTSPNLTSPRPTPPRPTPPNPTPPNLTSSNPTSPDPTSSRPTTPTNPTATR